MNNTSQQASIGGTELSLSSLLSKYVIYWPWFFLSIIICLITGFIYLYYTPPIYQVSASVQIKDEDQKKNFDWENLDIGSLSSTSSSIEDESSIMMSESIIEEVVKNLHLYCTYSFDDRILYTSTPLTIEPLVPNISLLGHSILCTFTLDSPQSGHLELLDQDSGKTDQRSFFHLPFVTKTSLGTFEISSNPNQEKVEPLPYPCEMLVEIKPLNTAVAYFRSHLNISPKSKNSSILSITLKTNHIETGKDFLQSLINVYNLENNNYKNEMATKTGEFINQRLNIINQELGNTEEELALFKQKSGLTDLMSDAQLALSGNAEYNKLRVENSTQISLINWLKDYLQNSTLFFEPLPQNIGLKDEALLSQVERYNQILVERKRLLRSSTESNPRILDLDTSIRAMHQTLISTAKGTLKSLLIIKSKLDQESSRFDRRITDAPKLERRLVDISRRQEIKSNLYLMLLQKREENAITLSASTNTARLIGHLNSNESPVYPKSKMVYLVALLVGFVLPVFGIWLYEQMKIRLDSVESIKAITSLPLVGTIPLYPEKLTRENTIIVLENGNSSIIEAFRRVRSNLKFMLGKNQKVILVTSSTSREGKTFFASNLAVSLSFLSKKVLIVGLDLRNPRLDRVFKIPRSSLGITSYLSDPTIDLFSLIHDCSFSKSLSVLPCGIIPPNPSELLSRDVLKEAISELKKHYDYILLDAAPYGLVSDTLSLSSLADLCVYVCRADYTLKADFECVNQWSETHRNTCILFNGVDLKKRKYRSSFLNYGYQYSNRYGREE